MVLFRQEIESDGIETSKALALRGGHYRRGDVGRSNRPLTRPLRSLQCSIGACFAREGSSTARPFIYKGSDGRTADPRRMKGREPWRPQLYRHSYFLNTALTTDTIFMIDE